MATELLPPQIPIPPPPAAATTPTIPEAPPPLSGNPPLPPAQKRQRRPSVRLGEIGDQPATLRTRMPNFSGEKNRSKSKRGFPPKRARPNCVTETSDFRGFGIEPGCAVKDNNVINIGDIRVGDHGVESDRNSGRGGSSDRVRSLLIKLGLSRYMPVFEIHEVDDEVLPLLTLEDLMDMGINAVGSRRKIFAALQKLGRGYSS